MNVRLTGCKNLTLVVAIVTIYRCLIYLSMYLYDLYGKRSEVTPKETFINIIYKAI